MRRQIHLKKTTGNIWVVRKDQNQARYLHRGFLYQKNREESEAVNLMRLLDLKTKKESARLFYEMLVLKTEGLVDVRQDEAYVDILVQKLLQWDQIYVAFCL